MAILEELKDQTKPNLGPVDKRSTKFIDGLAKEIKKHPQNVFYTLWAFDLLNLLLFVFIPFTYILQIFYYNRPKEHSWNDMFRIITKSTLTLSGVTIEVEGLEENVPKNRGVIFTPNHTSFLDGPVMDIATLFHPARSIVAPTRFFPFPFGFWLRKIGSIDVVRDDEEKEKYHDIPRPREAIQKAAQKAQNGEYVLVFPEGHMERDKQLMYFHTGAVRIALKARVNIVPITIIGASEVLPAKKFLLNPGKIRIIFHKPINLKKYYGMYENHELVKRLTWELEKDVIEGLPKSFIPDAIMDRLPEYLKEKRGWE